MRALASELISIAFFVVVGWTALWPARRRLGAAAYHLAGLPVGLLAAPVAGAVSTVTGRPLDLLSAVAGGLLLTVALWAVQRVVLGANVGGRSSVGVRSFAVATGGLGVLGIVLGLARFTVSNNDSFMSYWPLGVQLARDGVFTARLVATRSTLIPSMNAIHVTFGSDWAYVIYPMLGATLALWLGMTLWRGPLRGSTRRKKLLVAGGAAVFLVLEPSFVFHSFFVHAHMASAVYLLMSLTCLWMAVPPGVARGEPKVRVAYLIPAGVFAAGFALARPDGLAYQFVPVVVAISVLTIREVRWRSVAAFFGPLLFIVGVSYSATFVTSGLWTASKLSGRTALLILAVLALSAAGPWIVEWLDRFLPLRVSGERFLAIVVSLAAMLTLGVFVLKWSKAALALTHARINLFEGRGGYSYLWYAVVVVLVLSIFTRDALRRSSWTRSPFLAIALFFIIALLVHGTSHPGRIGDGDSLNRVVFHAFPLVVWYAGALAARILGQSGAAEQT